MIPECPHCGNVKPTGRSLSAHIMRCAKNPNRKGISTGGQPKRVMYVEQVCQAYEAGKSSNVGVNPYPHNSAEWLAFNHGVKQKWNKARA